MPLNALKNSFFALLLLFLGGISQESIGSEYKRSQIRIVGSSAVYPFAATVAERFAFHHDTKTPIVESIGSGGGFKVFCRGVGPHYPDIVVTSRPMSDKEKKQCRSRRVVELYEIEIGYDGIVLTLSTTLTPFNVTRQQLYLALAEQVPIAGKLIDNPYHKWSDIDPSLPHQTIQVFGPSPTSGTRDAFTELVMLPGCEEAKSQYRGTSLGCARIREDGAYVDIGANENMVIQKVVSSPGAIGIVSYSFLRQNRDRVNALSIEGVTPNFLSIKQGEYIVSRPLFLYAKAQHEPLIPSLNTFLKEFLEQEAAGRSGYLRYKGLIPLSDTKRQRQYKYIENHQPNLNLLGAYSSP